MAHRLRLLDRLQDEQDRASNPADHAALSASAGTGKTHVLTARVLRLLLHGVDPSTILCLTFTKAGAAEMAQRIHARLAYWVRLKDSDLRKELFALGEATDDPALARARTLFAQVLDAPGGGLRIQTIHAFAQGLLAAFPAEAGLIPGFRPLEGREEQILARQVLADMLVRAQERGEGALLADVQALSRRLGEGSAEAFLKECARLPDSMAGLGPPELIEDRLRRAFDLPLGDIDEAIAGQCCDELFDLPALAGLAEANRVWGTPTGLSCCEVIAAWQARNAHERAQTLPDIAELVLTRSGDPRKASAGLVKADPEYEAHAARLIECCSRLLRMRRLAAFVTCLAAGLRAGRRFAQAWTAAKRAHGVVDFDDLIRWTERLLAAPGMGEWVRYKLDQATDHVLVDEAQDTNEAQWSIVGALVEEYFAGEGAGARHRTLFTVGDFKQAIFGFQGTDPRQFERARSYFEAKAKLVRQSAIDADLPERSVPPDFLDLSMDRSFRSSPPVLEAVDALIGHLGHEAFGLLRPANPHRSHHPARPGSVTLWHPFTEEAAEAEAEDAGDEGWASDTLRHYARKLARQVRRWVIDQPFMLGEGRRQRPVRPEDVLILVRRRGELASLLVARLHEERVPVAGVDRLVLTAPLAVQDLLAAVRFAVQPLDDLNLGALLVSPLFGWTQDQLFEVSFGRDGPLWHSVRTRAETEGLHQILAMADYATPHQFLETVLSGDLNGRRKMLERLGFEARDPIEELLSSALEFEASAGSSLERFLDWFARGEVEIVRDPSAPLDAVRVMTVHGSKGLQAPVVILADAGADPDRAKPVGRTVSFSLEPDGPRVPVFRPRRAELAEPLAGQVAEQDRLEREEHWRLLYVAMTRAEERLYVGGALGSLAKGVPPAASWWSAVDGALGLLGSDWVEDPDWGRARRWGQAELFTKSLPRPSAGEGAELPNWIHRPAPPEARPPRPLAPSSLGEDLVLDPPPSPAAREAALRGRLLHQLFERLPALPPDERSARGDQWLRRSAGVEDQALRRALLADAGAIISDPRHAELFGPDALAEAPLAAVVGDGVVVSGTVDRLLVAEDRILVADFKTGRRAPAALEEIPIPHLRQIAHYAAALEAIFPGRRIEAKLLYTAAPVLFDLPPELLARFGPLEAAAAAP